MHRIQPRYVVKDNKMYDNYLQAFLLVSGISVDKKQLEKACKLANSQYTNDNINYSIENFKQAINSIVASGDAYLYQFYINGSPRELRDYYNKLQKGNVWSYIAKSKTFFMVTK